MTVKLIALSSFEQRSFKIRFTSLRDKLCSSSVMYVEKKEKNNAKLVLPLCRSNVTLVLTSQAACDNGIYDSFAGQNSYNLHQE